MDQRALIEPDQIRQRVIDAGLVPEKLPGHVAVIMDGNGRWAKAQGLPHIAGHRAGTESLRRLVQASIELGIPYVTIFAFSTENWQRPRGEVRGLLFILEDVIKRQLDELDANGVQLRHIGWMDRIPAHLVKAIHQAVERTRHNQQLVLSVAFNYGGRQEIARAVRRIVEAGIPAEAIDEACVSRHLDTAGLPDPDLIIRTSGEMRLSNFLLWQAAYSEYYSTPTLWPDFDRQTLVEALGAFGRRERRFGTRPQEAGARSARRSSAAGARSGAAPDRPEA